MRTRRVSKATEGRFKRGERERVGGATAAWGFGPYEYELPLLLLRRVKCLWGRLVILKTQEYRFSVIVEATALVVQW